MSIEVEVLTRIAKKEADTSKPEKPKKKRRKKQHPQDFSHLPTEGGHDVPDWTKECLS